MIISLFAADAVAVAVQTVYVRAYDDDAPDESRAVSPSAGAVNVARDRHARTFVARVAPAALGDCVKSPLPGLYQAQVGAPAPYRNGEPCQD